MSILLDKLDEIEAELKAIGYWFEGELLAVHQVTFEHWLQFTFLPEARQRVEAGDLPEDSQVGLMALRQYDYHSFVPEAQRLLGLLNEFDALVRAA